MFPEFEQQLSATLDEIKAQGLYKKERVITGPQNAKISIADGRQVINFCANNYLGLASVRFICGTQDIHKELEGALTKFLGTEETILYPSCFDANGGLFETLLAEK